jgi:hypothetical protein
LEVWTRPIGPFQGAHSSIRPRNNDGGNETFLFGRSLNRGLFGRCIFVDNDDPAPPVLGPDERWDLDRNFGDRNDDYLGDTVFFISVSCCRDIFWHGLRVGHLSLPVKNTRRTFPLPSVSISYLWIASSTSITFTSSISVTGSARKSKTAVPHSQSSVRDMTMPKVEGREDPRLIFIRTVIITEYSIVPTLGPRSLITVNYCQLITLLL